MSMYHKALSVAEKEENHTQQDDIAIQAKCDWLAATITQSMFKSIAADSNALLDDAMRLATVNHQQDNSKQIVHKLIEANTLRKVMEKYATTNPAERWS